MGYLIIGLLMVGIIYRLIKEFKNAPTGCQDFGVFKECVNCSCYEGGQCTKD
jgi:hypothetical protein